MLAVTGAAAETIAGLTARLGDTGEGGLRVAAAVELPDRLALSLAQEPADGDRVVVADGGAQVFLDPHATELLADKVLDVRKGAEGEFDFTLTDQG